MHTERATYSQKVRKTPHEPHKSTQNLTKLTHAQDLHQTHMISAQLIAIHFFFAGHSQYYEIRKSTNRNADTTNRLGIAKEPHMQKTGLRPSRTSAELKSSPGGGVGGYWHV